MYRFFAFIIVMSVLFSCSKLEIRKPVTHNSSISHFEETIKLNKALLNREISIFKEVMEKDTINEYIVSPYGFWYFYSEKNTLKKIQVKSGDEVVINYEIRDTNNKILISKEELGTKGQSNKADRLLKIDGENFILGLHQGIKLMQVGEVATFLLPSNKAFGLLGLSDRIAANQALIIKVRLKKILNK